MIKFTDISHQAVWVNPQTVTILIPSPLDHTGDGKCRIVTPGLISIVSREEAERLVEALTTDGTSAVAKEKQVN